ncbi:hypothetical protein BCBMB205_32720 [Bacillus sp. CN2]|nr:hypothetical protein BCBMB205_32720 [Bacillus velezensis]ARZ59617.1 hypothetical protein BAGQ_3412 [Bacillus velezensis]GFR54692.1 hypothetical protein BCBMB205_32720 [Bacillus sp. CN2]
MKPPHDASAAGADCSFRARGRSSSEPGQAAQKTKVPRKLQNADVLQQSGAF